MTGWSESTTVEDLLRTEAPQVLGAVVRRYSHFDLAEDAVQEALIEASRRWPVEGIPQHPRSWLIRVASNALTDLLRSEVARRRREEQVLTAGDVAPPPDLARPADDDSLVMLSMCCHPSLTPNSAVALTLRAVGGLSTEEIAAAFLVPSATIGQRISRAKQTVRKSGEPFGLPARDEWPERLAEVLRVLYLIFNEGYTASSGSSLVRTELSAEAIRLARMLHRSLPEEGEVAGLLALMLLTDARRPARVGPSGSAIPIAEQNRELWDQELIEEGTRLVTAAMTDRPLGPYQIQAAIGALHDGAAHADQTDWPQILGLYTLLTRFDPSPMVALNRAVAVAMVHGPDAGLAEVSKLRSDAVIDGYHRLESVRAHLLEMAGRHSEAVEAYAAAAALTLSTPERRYLQQRAASLGHA